MGEAVLARPSAMRSASSSDVGLGVHIVVGAGVTRIVYAVGFGNCVAWHRTDVRTKAGVQPVSLSPSQHGATVGVTDTVKRTKSLRLPTI